MELHRHAPTLADPVFVARDEIFANRPERASGQRFDGLWVSGTLAGLQRRAVAIVGTRAPSDGGRARARGLASELAQAGVCIVSGLALGIDGAAHAGAVAGGGATIGVLGGGHRHFFPQRNRVLAEAMLDAGGAVLSPYPPDEPARPPQFLQRNAVVAALVDAVVVVEAAQRSGALNTAGWAGGLGVDVLAFPGDVDRPKAAGCNALIRDGATLVRDAEDVLGALGIASGTRLPVGLEGPRRDSRPAGIPAGNGDTLAERLLQLLADAPRELDALTDAAGAPAGSVLAALVRLEIEGAIERRDAATFAAIR
jgi:DNA processing protein